MAEREQRPIPPWAERERREDMAWIAENLQDFWAVAKAGYEKVGRGALIVDTMVQPTGGGHPFGYITQEQIRQLGSQDEMRMVAAYDPAWELVIILLKAGDRMSSYRIGIPAQQSRPSTR